MSDIVEEKKQRLGWRYYGRRAISSGLILWAYRILPEGHPAERDLRSFIKAHDDYDDLTTEHVLHISALEKSLPPSRVKKWFQDHPKIKSVLFIALALLLLPGSLFVLSDPRDHRDVEGGILTVSFSIYLLIIYGWILVRRRVKPLSISLPIDQPFSPKPRAPLALRLPSVGMPVDLQSLIRFGRTTPRAAALIDASRCWGVIFAAWIIAEQFVPVWSYEAFPTDERAYVWYAAFTVIGVAFGGYFYLASKAKGPADYRLMGRAILQLGIGAGVLLAGAWLGGKLGAEWPDNTFGLIAIWLLVTATARIITLPWFPSIKQLRRR